MKCPGIVTNVTNFGAFVDIGVHQDGLVHISQLSDRFIKDPRDVVNPGDRVTVRVLEVNLEKRQIALSMKSEAEAGGPKRVAGGDARSAPGQNKGGMSGAKPKPVQGGFNNPFAKLNDLKKKN
jgi:uncharacterized protein